MNKQKRMRIIGNFLYVAGWPFWLVYFRLYWQRSRVLLVCGDEVLLVQGIINKAGNWALPGGGCDKGESPLDAAIREVKEEAGIKITASELRHLGAERIHSGVGIYYTAEYFTAVLPKKPKVTLQPHEILQAAWVPLVKVHEYPLQPDVLAGLQKLTVS